MSNCPSCGTQSMGESNFCHKCGYSYAGETGKLDPDTLLENRYVIVKTLGRGGMGAVYQALDLRLNNTPVAIKEMSTRAVGQGNLQAAIAAFKKEATMLVSLKHPALPRISDFFSKGEDRWYLVMDYINGETLAEAVKKRGKIPQDEVFHWAVQLCDILDYLHSQKPPVIFRDLKPSNIMITSSGEISLVDFGIARHFRSGSTSDTMAYGSPGYAPPEQYGEYQTDPRSDLYALGAVLHHLLTGKDPGKNPFTFECPGKTFPVSPALETTIMKALELNPVKRPGSAREMLELIKKDHSMVTGKTQVQFLKKEELEQITEFMDENNSDAHYQGKTMAENTETLLISDSESNQNIAKDKSAEVDQEATVSMVTIEESIKEMLEQAQSLEEQGKHEEALNTYQLTQKLILPGSMVASKLQQKINEVKRKLELGLYNVKTEQEENEDVMDAALPKLMIQGRLYIERGKYKEALEACRGAQMLVKAGSIEAEELKRMIRQLERRRLVIAPDNRTKTLYIKDKKKLAGVTTTLRTSPVLREVLMETQKGTEEKFYTETLTINKTEKELVETTALRTEDNCPVLESINGEEKIVIDKAVRPSRFTRHNRV